MTFIQVFTYIVRSPSVQICKHPTEKHRVPFELWYLTARIDWYNILT